MKPVRIFAVLMMCIVMAACGSSGGKDDGGGTTPVTPVTPTTSYNFTGVVYGESGTPLPGVTIYVFSPSYTTITSNPSTDSSGNADPGGKFNLNVSGGEHALMAFRAGSKEVFQIFNLTSSGGSIKDLPVMLYNSAVSPVNVVAFNSSYPDKWTKITSNSINGYAATLNIPPQSSGSFKLGDQSVKNADITFENLDLSKPLPVPLPSTATLDQQDVVIGGKQAPSVMVAIQSARLSWNDRAELILPNPNNLRTRVLRFDHEAHRWRNTGHSTDSTFVPVTQGGVYGIFFEDRRTSTVRGTAPAGSAVFAGDEIITVKGDGTFIATVAMPPQGKLEILNVANVSTDSKSPEYKSSQATADFNQADKPGLVIPDQVVTVEFGKTALEVTVGSVTVKSDSDTLAADGTSSVTITAELSAKTDTGEGSTDTANSAIPDGTVVTFSVSSNSKNEPLGTFSSATAKTSGGVATVKLTSIKDRTGIATVTASAGNVSGKTDIKIVARPASMAMSLTKADGTPGISVKSDGSDYINIMATVLNTERVPIPNLYVSFKVDGGQISVVDKDGNPAVDSTGQLLDPTNLKTGNDGKATIRFSAGSDEKINRTVTLDVTAGTISKTVTILITGSTISLSTDKSNLSIDSECKEEAVLTLTLKDAGSSPIFGVPVTATVTSGDTDSVSMRTGEKEKDSDQYKDPTKKAVLTDLNGELKIYVCGRKAGKTTVKVEAKNSSDSNASLSAEQIFTITDKDETFGIIEPDKKALNNLPAEVKVKTDSIDSFLTVRVRAPKASKVRFSTTFGYWNGQTASQVTDVSVGADGTASAVVRSVDAGLANVQVFGYTAQEIAENKPPSFSDGIQVAFYTPSSEASQISLQASASVIPPSKGDVINSITLTATVKNFKDQVVKDVPVAFSLENTTGGGEYVSPTVVYTNALGVAEAKFYSGALSSKADDRGIIIKATNMTGTPKTASIDVVIGGTPTSIIISRSTKEVTAKNDTTYQMPMSVVVVDSKGNPVPKTKITLGAWPSRYETGLWSPVTPCGPVYFGDGPFKNEDENRNLIIDPGEDKHPDGGDGKLTPPASASGAVVPGTIETDENGVGTFILEYPKVSSAWIEDEITASTVVLGTETKSLYAFWLPYLKDEECNLFHSPYNDRVLPKGSMILNAVPNILLSNGTSTSEITASFTDFRGLPITDGTAVSFKVSGGGGFPYSDSISAKTAGGVASVDYQAPQKVNGIVTITATAEDPNSKEIISATTTITLGIGAVQITASPAELTADGTSTSSIRITAVDSIGRLAGAEPILMSIVSGSGSLSGTTVTTSSGIVTASYTAGRTPGAVTIRAEMVNTGASATTSINLIGTGVAFITLKAEPDSIKADGFSSSKITATIIGSGNSPVLSGTPVEFKTTMGKFPNGSDTYSVTTTGTSGIAVVALISGYEEGTATVTCTAAGSTQTTTVKFTGATSSPDAKPAYILPAPMRDSSGNALCLNSTGTSGICDSSTYTIPYNYPYPKSISVLGTQGNTTSKIVFTVYDNKGRPLTNKTRVDFQISSQPNGGERLLSLFDYTNDKGEVSTILKSGLKSGPVIVKAVCFQTPSITASSEQIAIGGGYPTGEGFSLSAQYLNISGLSTYGLQDAITARLTDDYGNNVTDGTSVSFKTYNTGGYMNPPSAVTSAGAASSNLITSGPEPENGIVTVTAEANGSKSTHITSLAVVRETESNRIVYAGTSGGGVYKSSDSGQTWINISRSGTIAGQNRIDPYVNDILVDPNNSSIVYAATGYGGKGNVYRSRDGGQTWTDNDPKGWRGLFPITAAVSALEYDDTDGLIWIGTVGSGIYRSDSLTPFENTLFTYVNDIVKVGGQDILYVGTDVGVYGYRRNQTPRWTTSTAPFNHYITSLAVHPRSNGNIVYAGTRDSGVWVSVDAGKSWTQYTEGFGKGVFATYPQTKVLTTGTTTQALNLGNGSMSDVKVLSKAKSESWTVTYAGTSFKVTGSVSGEQTQKCNVNQKCTFANVMEFTITAGTEAFKEGDTFTFDIFSDDGRHIKDIFADGRNNRLYALTYFKPDVAAHASGLVYVHDLNTNGEMAYTDWREVTTGLSLYDSMNPYDTSLFANHVIASDDPTGEYSTMLYLGGEGIGFYRASLSSGQVATWQQNNTGLSNLIMARMPIYFTGSVYMEYDNGILTFTDLNGNPPIQGSKVVITPTSGTQITYTFDGLTWIYPGSVPAGAKVTFTPLCSTTVAPGCSGSEQIITIPAAAP